MSIALCSAPYLNASLLGGDLCHGDLELSVEAARAGCRGRAGRGQLVSDTLGSREGNARNGGNKSECGTHVVDDETSGS